MHVQANILEELAADLAKEYTVRRQMLIERAKVPLLFDTRRLHAAQTPCRCSRSSRLHAPQHALLPCAFHADRENEPVGNDGVQFLCCRC